nr:vegetative cell wall protein gp1-like [Aegilops tauschii subsp. strangulata]
MSAATVRPLPCRHVASRAVPAVAAHQAQARPAQARAGAGPRLARPLRLAPPERRRSRCPLPASPAARWRASPLRRRLPPGPTRLAGDILLLPPAPPRRPSPPSDPRPAARLPPPPPPIAGDRHLAGHRLRRSPPPRPPRRRRPWPPGHRRASRPSSPASGEPPSPDPDPSPICIWPGGPDPPILHPNASSRARIPPPRTVPSTFSAGYNFL